MRLVTESPSEASGGQMDSGEGDFNQQGFGEGQGLDNDPGQETFGGLLVISMMCNKGQNCG